jgi:hypothetical protein
MTAPHARLAAPQVDPTALGSAATHKKGCRCKKSERARCGRMRGAEGCLAKAVCNLVPTYWPGPKGLMQACRDRALGACSHAPCAYHVTQHHS